MAINTGYSDYSLYNDQTDLVLGLLKQQEIKLANTVSAPALFRQQSQIEEAVINTNKLIDNTRYIDLQTLPLQLVKMESKVTDPINIIRDEKYKVNTSKLSEFLSKNVNLCSLDFSIFNKDGHKCGSIVLSGKNLDKLHYTTINIHATSNKYKIAAYLQDLDNFYVIVIQNVTGKTAKEESKKDIDQSYLNNLEINEVKVTYRD